MAKNKRNPKSVLKLPDLEQSKSAVLKQPHVAEFQRSYDHAIREFIDWCCSEPRLAFNRTVVTRYEDQPRTGALRLFHHQPPPCGDSAACTCGRGPWASKSRSSCRHSP